MKEKTMKILHIAPQPPSIDSGGGLGVYQTIKSLALNQYSVDYVGVPIKNVSICKLYEKLYYIEANHNVFIRFFDVLRGITNSRYRSWVDLKLNIDDYDIVVLDFTKLDYIIEKIGKTPLIVKVHNVEYDYSRVDYLNDKNLIKKILSKLSYNQEKRLLDRANKILALTHQDISRLEYLYKPTKKKFSINGVCVEDHAFQHSYEKVKLLITGSLWFMSNVKGIMWFINNVYTKLSEEGKLQLVIAGRQPRDELKALCKKYKSIYLIDSPDDMNSIFSEANLAVAPIFEGAGMKIKVAEALSHGLPVIGTNHAFIGYSDESNDCLVPANNSEDFIRVIREFMMISEKEFMQRSEKAHMLFLNNYSMTVSALQWKNAIESVKA